MGDTINGSAWVRRHDTGGVDIEFADGTGKVLDPSAWPAYRKHAVTHAIRMEGPFTVETSEGTLDCEDGYVAVDARGYPYPIAAEEFALIYEEA